jgi:ribose 5-phosphate isomerase A
LEISEFLDGLEGVWTAGGARGLLWRGPGGPEETMSDPKEISGRRAADYVEDGMTLGLGTGSTVWFSLLRLAERIREEGLEVRGVPTSLDTQRKSEQLGIPLVDLSAVRRIDLTIDGADEIDGRLDMIKGGGGALLREKVVASISAREIIVVGRAKVVERLGTTFRLPVEVVPFARPVVAAAIEAFGARPELRRAENGGEYRTDNGNEILDCSFAQGIADAAALELALDAIPGVVESGLCVGLPPVMVIGDPAGGCEVIERPSCGARLRATGCIPGSPACRPPLATPSRSAGSAALSRRRARTARAR